MRPRSPILECPWNPKPNFIINQSWYSADYILFKLSATPIRLFSRTKSKFVDLSPSNPKIKTLSRLKARWRNTGWISRSNCRLLYPRSTREYHFLHSWTTSFDENLTSNKNCTLTYPTKPPHHVLIYAKIYQP